MPKITHAQQLRNEVLRVISLLCTESRMLGVPDDYRWQCIAQNRVVLQQKPPATVGNDREK